ncbi:hypothetical protein [Bartonella birtlesii]|uniref:DUF1453 domain-containing protein n=1 Tax=Bartonella birtlesii LL-WM9 TaxID=1094552 RepID=J1J2E2_9HYPH|nr:hypothetical protein [Bartonella birtlesii]EJF78237.1 hypothetical protein ME7_00228 [Bartonella birtlesii LL-WM9]
MSLSNIMTGTPKWAWILLIFLIVRGIIALKDREVKVYRLFLLPLVFLFLGVSDVIKELAFPVWGAIAMFGGLMIGVGVGWLLWHAIPRLKIKQGTDLIILPGTPLTLTFILIAFVIKFILIVFLKVEPDLKYAFDFNLLFGLLSGLTDGVFWGGTLNLYITFRKNPN